MSNSEDDLKEYLGEIESQQSAFFTVNLRDYFAAKAMQSNFGLALDRSAVTSKKLIALTSYEMADAMLAARGESK